MKLLKMDLFSSSLVYHPLCHKCFPQHPVLQHFLSVFFPQVERSIFTPIQDNKKGYNSIYFSSNDSSEQTGRRNILNRLVANISQIKSALKFFMTAILIC